MNDKVVYLIGVIGLFTLLVSIYLSQANFQTNENLNVVVKDLNVLKGNDQLMANYIQSNSNALVFLNGCMQTKDNNTTIELVCKKMVN